MIVRPSFTVLVGTKGRPSIRRTIDSFIYQDHNLDDRLLITFDSYVDKAAGESAVTSLAAARVTIDYVSELAHPRARQIQVHEYDSGYHWLGVEQMNWTYRTIDTPSTHYIVMGDDDIFVRGAFARLRAACDPDLHRPVLYRFVSPWRAVLWDEPRLLRSHISGCCIACPRRFMTSHPTALYVEHDFDWIVGIVDRAAKNSGRTIEPLWLDDVLVVARPDAGTDAVKEWS